MNFWTVDAFTNELFKGNPAGVLVIDHFPADDLMQSIAAEINLSETAFVVPESQGHFHIRWFTPTTEVKLCGHATLAAAHILWEQKHPNSQEILYFDSKSGVLKVKKEEAFICLDLPSYGIEPMSLPEGLVQALGETPVSIARSHDDIIVELGSVEQVVNLAPKIDKLARIESGGIIVTADGEEGDPFDFVSRYFAPHEGISEDPVTGSAHCKLAPYWAERLGKTEFIAYQASKRGGTLSVRYLEERVQLLGQAVTVFMGRFLSL